MHHHHHHAVAAYLLCLLCCFIQLIDVHACAFVPAVGVVEQRYHRLSRVQSSSSSDVQSSGVQSSIQVQQEADLSLLSLLSQDQIDQVSSLVERRARARWEGDYQQADILRAELQDYPLLEDSNLSILLQDVPRNDGGGCTWTVVRNNNNDTSSSSLLLEGTTVLQLAHAALGLAIASSEQGISVNKEQLDGLVQEACTRLTQSPNVELELRGRKAADAAFWFALAGVSPSDELLTKLADIAASELNRFGSRKSCRAKDVYQIMERLTAAGLRYHPNLQTAAMSALAGKKEKDNSRINNNNNNLLDFHSDRCLLMIWKFSTKQRKQRVFLESARNHWLNENESNNNSISTTRAQQRDPDATIDWNQLYKDPTKPLILDIGCGMGVSLLGLAQQQQQQQQQDDDDNDDIAPFNDCNFAGVDLSGLAINYAQGIAKSWKLDSNLQFFFDGANSFVEKVAASYPGPVQLCMVQFPTPYRLPTTLLDLDDEQDDSKEGNDQLPSSATAGFMVSEQLLTLIHNALMPDGGKVLIQSNCEDVAVWIRNTAIGRCNFENINNNDDDDVLPVVVPNNDIPPTTPTKRTLDWIAMGGERAQVGAGGWSAGPLLPRKGRTETEVACMINGTPVHRCLLVKGNNRIEQVVV